MIKEIGIPDAPPAPCHDVPTFGCDSCITRDREAYATKVYLEWKKTYVIPKCRDCAKTMRHDGVHSSAGEIRALLVCPRIDVDGEAMCDDPELTVVIG